MDCIVHGVSKSQTQLSNFHLTLHHMVAKVLQLQLQQSVLPMNIQGWFSLGSTGLTSLQSKGLSRVFSNTMIWKHQFFGNQSSLQSNSHIRTWLWKTIALTIWTFVGKVVSLLFNILSRFVIAFHPRSKCLLIPWLQSPLECVAIPFSRRSFWPRDWIQVSCIAGRFFTVWATREALCSLCIPSFYKTKKCRFDTASVVWPWRLQQEPPARAQSSSLNFLSPENHFIVFLGPALLLQLQGRTRIPSN